MEVAQSLKNTHNKSSFHFHLHTQWDTGCAMRFRTAFRAMRKNIVG